MTFKITDSIHSCLALTWDYYLGAEARTQQLDGEKQSASVMLSAPRWGLLAMQTASLGYGASHLKMLTFMGTALPLISMGGRLLSVKIATCHQTLHEKGWLSARSAERVHDGILFFFDTTHKTVDKLGDNAYRFTQVLSTVHYLFFLSQGHTAIGIAGIFEVALLEAKAQGRVPAKIENLFYPLSLFAAVYGTNRLFSIYNPAWWIFNIKSTYPLVNWIAKCLHIQVDPYKDKSHELGQTRKEIQTCFGDIWDFDQGEIKENSADTLFEYLNALEVNPTYLYSRKGSDLLPETLQEELRKVDAKTLFDELREKIQEQGIVLTPNEGEQKTGFDKVEEALIREAFPDAAIPRIETFVLIVKALLHSLNEEEDPQIFEDKLKEFDKAGNQCSEGWIRDFDQLYSEKSTDPERILLHDLSIFRSESLRKIHSMLWNGITIDLRFLGVTNPDETVRKIIGGPLNVHLDTEIQRAFDSVWHTSASKKDLEVYGRSLIPALLERHFVTDCNQPLFPRRDYEGASWKQHFLYRLQALPRLYQLGAGSRLRTNYSFFDLVIGPGQEIGLWSGINSLMRDHFHTPEKLKNHIQAQMTPDKPGAATAIEWSIACSWLSELNNHLLSSKEEEGPAADQTFLEQITQTTHEKLHLNENGVKLMLWYYGVLRLPEGSTLAEHKETFPA